jgi:gag-polypeptide of LTR copia-type
MQIKHLNNAKLAWESLRNLYNSSGFTSEFLLIKDFFNITLNNFSNIEEYLNKVKEIIEELNSREIIIPEKVIIAWILNNLNESYNSYITNIS